MRKPLHTTRLMAALTLAAGSPSIFAAESLALEEIVVTATKREQSLQDVAIAVSAITGAAIKDSLLANSEELTTVIPSLNLQKGGASRASSFNIRGIGTQSFSSGIEPSVSTVLDGVVLGRSGLAFTQLMDVQRIEVLRGPQGTLFGKNASGGVVHIITKDPTHDLEAGVSFSAAERGEYRAGFTYSNGVTDDLAFRLTGSALHDDGYIKNYATGDNNNQIVDSSIRGKLLWDFNEDTSVKLSADFQRIDGNCCSQTLRSLDPFPGITATQRTSQLDALGLIAPVTPAPENFAANFPTATFTDTESKGVSIEVNTMIGDHTLTSITASRAWEQVRIEEVNNRPLPAGQKPLVEQGGGTDQEQFTQEFRLTSPSDQFLSYVAGFYYFDQSLNRVFERTLNIGTRTGTRFSDGNVDTLNYAVFGEATFNFSDTMRLVLGSRFTKDELDVNFEAPTDPPDYPFQPAIPYFEKDTSESNTSFKAVLQFDVAEDTMAYVSYAQGYKGPAFNIIAGSTPANTNAVDPETADAIEIGFKSEFFDNQLRLNAALFWTEYDDFQAQNTEAILTLDANGNPQDADGNGELDTSFAFLLNNVGKVATKGLELDFQALVSDRLTITGGLALIDAEIKEYPGGPCNFAQSGTNLGFNGQTTCVPANPADAAEQDLSGGDLPQSPDWKLTLSANYLVPLADMPFDVILKGQLRAQDDVLYSIEQDPLTVQDAYEVLNLAVTLQDKQEHYTVTAFVKNALDDYYSAGIAPTSFQVLPNTYLNQQSRYAKRTAGIEVRYNW